MRYLIAPVAVLVIGLVSCTFGLPGFGVILALAALAALIWWVGGRMNGWLADLSVWWAATRARTVAWFGRNRGRIAWVSSIVTTLAIAGFFFWRCGLPALSRWAATHPLTACGACATHASASTPPATVSVGRYVDVAATAAHEGWVKVPPHWTACFPAGPNVDFEKSTSYGE